MFNIKQNYDLKIYYRYRDLINSGKTNDTLDNNDLSKIFEYYSCIKLTEEYNEKYYEYDDIDLTYKENNRLSKTDTGIDACNMKDTIVQCKLRKDALTWKECGTFFGSQNVFNEETLQPEIKWKKLIITRNSDSKLSENLLFRKKLFIDKTYDKVDLLEYCKNLYNNPPKINKHKEPIYKLRDYQEEAIKLIQENNKNIIICLPTGTGKNLVIIYSMENDKKYLILVPRIILMEQLKKEIIKHKPEWKHKIQCIGDKNNKFIEDKNITICIYNSIEFIKEKVKIFNKIYIDEAHHINVPEIYNIDEKNDVNNKLSYTNIIRNFKELNNNIYLSATIDEEPDWLYYKKDIRNMIENNYISDYKIHIPIFNDDPTNKNICEYLIKNYRSIIIYCNSQREGYLINELMNKIQKSSSEYIDCYTPKGKRNKIIEKFISGELPFLVNVKILVEGFNAEITRGVCFMHLPSSQTTLIQIIGRALRLNNEKKYAHIILPYSSKDDEYSINNFIKVISKNDRRILKSYIEKNTFGYITLENIIFNEENEENIKNVELKYEMIYDNLGKLTNENEIFVKRYEELKEWINKNNKIPSINSNDKIEKSLGIFCSLRRRNKKDNKLSNDKILLLEKLPKWYWNTDEIFMRHYEELKEWIKNNNKIPSKRSNDSLEKKLGIFCSDKRYDKKNNKLSNDKIILLSSLNYWYWGDIKIKKIKTFEEQYEELKKWININNRIPNQHSVDSTEKSLGKFCSHKRQDKKNNKLLEYRIQLLQQLPNWYWAKSEIKNNFYL